MESREGHFSTCVVVGCIPQCADSRRLCIISFVICISYYRQNDSLCVNISFLLQKTKTSSFGIYHFSLVSFYTVPPRIDCVDQSKGSFTSLEVHANKLSLVFYRRFSNNDKESHFISQKISSKLVHNLATTTNVPT